MKWFRVVLDEAQFIRNRCVIQLYLATKLTLYFTSGPHGPAKWLPNFVLNSGGC